ncbi:signal transduction histidine kinase regulating citrate/malate metabolism [Actibacterium atlanticum]|uniref:Signal transduction histidine kinase regulating citrate/malate metabolism n=1 Tax=Actibacterium atlanticum TaxID=1461693 RepID=A0A058ZR31_9RHOB|nr:DUF6446 family protein [Actibacterium atlanticum]KCV83281.1 signal transduction histidine kinase regulating citrate/malate metabolism [Actibacterium atlanticum]
MSGKIIASLIVLISVLVGVGIYYQQIYAYYEPVSVDAVHGEVKLTSLVSGLPEVIPAESFEGIDAESSPLRYRACFSMPTSIATLTETYLIHEDPVPLIGPGWFDCFDAKSIGKALESGVAVGFMGQENITFGIDRVIAVFEDGRAYAWNQMNACGEAVFDGKPAPTGCPPAPEKN